MLSRVHIKNFKSIADLTIEPGTVNVVIGENGCGKSNFLEAMAFGSAAEGLKLDNEFLASRGLRISDVRFMRAAFTKAEAAPIEIALRVDDSTRRTYVITPTDGDFPRWNCTYFVGAKVSPEDHAKQEEWAAQLGAKLDDWMDFTRKMLAEQGQSVEPSELRLKTLRLFSAARPEATAPLTNFLIYAPENSALRNFATEGQILPLGIKGEGLFKLLRHLATDSARWAELTKSLKLFDWFDDLRLPPPTGPFEQTLQIRDRFLAKDFEYFDQRSANEGFLFLLFYFALLLSPDTPPIFAIDNVDVSLNPKMATALMRRMAELAKANGKQVFVTTHSPALLDGLDLTDDAQRLFVFQRGRKGATTARRVSPPKPLNGEPPVKLSEAFMRGLIGGLPQNF